MADLGWQAEILLTCSTDDGQAGFTVPVGLMGELAGLFVGLAVNVLLSDAASEAAAHLADPASAPPA